MKRQIRRPRLFMLFLATIVADLIAALSLALAGQMTAAWIIATPLLLLLLLGWVLLLAATDSRKRWPGLPFSQRLARILFFGR